MISFIEYQSTHGVVSIRSSVLSWFPVLSSLLCACEVYCCVGIRIIACVSVCVIVVCVYQSVSVV